MITKESLVQDREQANVALLELKQKYNPGGKDVYAVVEGKDDIAYYTCIFARYPKFSNVTIVSANNRKNVVKAFELTDWSVYSDKRVFFFVDRDLSEITGENTPIADNVYVTDEYSIENSLFNEDLFFVTLKIFFGVDNLEEEEIEVLSQLYHEARKQFESIFLPIMGWILYWRSTGFSCNLNNLNSGDFYKINQGVVELKKEFQHQEAVITEVHSQCGVAYSSRDISSYIQQICECGGLQKNIRGKYVRCFFVKLLHSTVDMITMLFPERKKPKAIVQIGYGNALQLLCGYMKTPQSLDVFLNRANT
ncbi:MAG: DUF4435 domain-containing protein [Acutalibacteraceae bacterium]|nr:DUF4435 domain-containing protein [Acutalibacteraceae bacterium]